MSDNQLEIPLSGGPNETVDPRLLPPGSVIAVKNAVYDADGQYQVRYGYTQLGVSAGGFPPAGTSLLRATTLTTFNNEMVCCDGSLVNQGGYNSLLWTYKSTVQDWRPTDIMSPVGVTHRPLQNATSSYQSFGEAIGAGNPTTAGAGFRVVAWVDIADGFPRVAIYDMALGSISENITLLATPSSHQAQNVQVCILGKTAIVTAFDVTSHEILAWTCDLTQLVPSWSAATVLSAADYTGITSPFGVYSMCVTGLTSFAIAYETTSAGAACITVRVFSAAIGVISAHQNSLGGAPPVVFGLAACCTGTTMWVGISLAASMTVMIVNPTTATATSTTTGIATAGSANCPPIGCCVIDATHCMFIVAGPLGSPRTSIFVMNGATASHVTKLHNVVPASAPFYVPSLQTCLAWVRGIATSTTNASYFLIDAQPTTILGSSSDMQPLLWAICAPGIVTSAVLPQSTPLICQVLSTSTQFETILPILRSGNRVGIDRFTFDLGANFRYRPAWLGRERYLSGARFDATRVAEIGFAWPPTNPLAQAAGVGTFNDTYNFAFTWLWVDSQGNAEESSPTFVNGVVAVNNLQFNITVDALTLTQKQRIGDANTGQGSKVFLNVYRTKGLSGGDTTLYRVTTDPMPAAAANVLTAATLTYTDTATDASIGANPVLYTLSGELAHSPPDQLTAVCAHMNRVWGIGADQRTIWYSQQYSDGEMPHWALTQQITVDDADEPLTALASLYDKLVVFSSQKMWVIYGQGPALSGAGNDLTEPQRLPSPGGCIDPRSVVNTPLGVMFQSQRGLELVDPGLAVRFIGQPVSVTSAAYPICTSAVYCENSSTVRFSMVTAEPYPSTIGSGGSGVILVYDIRRDRWSMHYLTQGGQGAQAATAGALVEAAAYHPLFGYFEAHNDTSSGAIVGLENGAGTANAWLDWGTSFVPLYVQLAWIKNGAPGLQGWMALRRVRALAQYYDHHGLKATFDYDYQSQAEAHPYTPTVVNGFVSGSWEQVRYRPAQGKCEAVRVTLETQDPFPIDGTSRGTGRGAGFTGLAFEIHAKKGGYRRIPVAANS